MSANRVGLESSIGTHRRAPRNRFGCIIGSRCCKARAPIRIRYWKRSELPRLRMALVRSRTLEHLTESVPTGDTSSTERTALLAALTGVVHAQDTVMVTAWAREISSD